MLKIGNQPNIMKNKAQEQNHKILSEDCILKHKVSSRIGQWLWEVAWNSSVFASFSSFSNSEQTKKNFLFIHTWQKQTEAKQTKQENSFESLLYERTKNQNRLPLGWLNFAESLKSKKLSPWNVELGQMVSKKSKNLKIYAC